MIALVRRAIPAAVNPGAVTVIPEQPGEEIHRRRGGYPLNLVGCPWGRRCHGIKQFPSEIGA
jgi:hypothetical protein